MYVYQNQLCFLYVNLKIKFIKEEKREKGEQLQNKRFKRPKKKKMQFVDLVWILI